MAMMKIRFMLVTMLGIATTLSARPEYAQRENKSCIHCHFNPNGSGPRNFLGHYYAKNGYSFKNTVYAQGVYEKQAPVAPDLSFQRPTAEGKLQTRDMEVLKSIRYRANSSSSYFSGAEMVKSGKDFVRSLQEAGIAYNKGLEEMLLREFFGAGLYNIETMALHSGMGLKMEHAPLVALRSKSAKLTPKAWLGERLKLFAKTAGYSDKEVFSPVYAEFHSGDPHYVAKPDFKSGKNQVWASEHMNQTITMESLGMGLYAKSVLASHYLESRHEHGVGITPRAGFLAQIMIYEMVNTMLWIRYGLAFDGVSFKSFPADYYESRDLLYIPHELMVEFDDKTKAPRSYYVKERLSYAKDLAALLMGLSEFYAMSDPRRGGVSLVFGEGSDDSAEFPFSWNTRHLARELILVVLKNLEMMHFDTRLGAIYSTATLVKPLEHIKASEIGLTMIGLGNVYRHFINDSEICHVAGNLMYALGQFTVQRLQATDGGIASIYDAKRNSADGLNRRLEDQMLLIRGFLEAYKVTREERFFNSAIRAYEFSVSQLWDEDLSTFRTHEDTRVLKITPENVGATVAALRELVLATGDLRTFAYKLAYFDGILKNYGLLLSELELTGEKMDSIADSDGDSILQADMAGQKFGVAPVFASEVQIEPVR